jgi:hypothetical protein
MVASVEPTTPSAAPADRSAMQNYRNDRLCRGFGHSALDIIQLNLLQTRLPVGTRKRRHGEWRADISFDRLDALKAMPENVCMRTEGDHERLWS